MADSFAQFAGKMDRLAREVTGKPVLHAIGKGAKADGLEAVKDDYGDTSLSNWWRGRPVQAAFRYDLKSDSEVEVVPAGRARGVVTVMQRGRQAGMSRRGRPYPASSGRGTWSDAVALMERRTPGRVEIETGKAIARIFNRG